MQALVQPAVLWGVDWSSCALIGLWHVGKKIVEFHKQVNGQVILLFGLKLKPSKYNHLLLKSFH